MNKAALFCDGTEGYVYPPEPKENELVTFRFRTAKDDADRVGLVKNAHRENLIIIRLKCVWGQSLSDIVSKCSLEQKNIIMDDVESLARSWSTITLL